MTKEELLKKLDLSIVAKELFSEYAKERRDYDGKFNEDFERNFEYRHPVEEVKREEIREMKMDITMAL